ncbi:ATP synthase F0F1 subunit epsilon [Ectothiorhodospira haloalkaliphila]|uniref:ATP synthase epsilon chain n=1 Tax=Ectothiorhodospira haloalkaliphila TaxID=421628 RepID=W8KTZ5_9GAMM|nr:MULTISPECIES: F0F1 ATP synthase subunit epsilon [Ectothiorhodospira]AHK80502.1 ATP synthase F0F1 subunit epsilon [Ectothiorhodospira haloalkaliphila]MCG5494550.1 F0F1 ATP synthase subunit epsilon [Ectothiorhodospira variabilis]MCG5496218.1 F0F1 ATP synthase subunit epsilon [Ectothiorhodospira variabilis]MCG5503541.1 F0F1 ATP synthase subunit epsilon [Ectothiorhodospira variabilis]MCG5506744.1 F0F1 ATP synthase subunit epsilon [Ectothiorhodospira variabilis]
MSMTFHVDIVSAEESIYSGTAHMLVAPAEHGEVGVMPRHSQYISLLKPGEIRVKVSDSGEEHNIFISGGVLEVQPHVVTVLADTAIRAKDLDEAEALEAKQRAEDALANRKADFDYAKAQSELIEAAARLRMIQKLRNSSNKQ